MANEGKYAVNDKAKNEENDNIEPRHYVVRRRLGEDAKRVRLNEEPVEATVIATALTCGFGAVQRVTDKRPNAHTCKDNRIAVAFLESRSLLVKRKNDYSAHDHKRVEKKRLIHTV